MTLAELEAAFADRRVLRHNGAVFVQTHDVEEAIEWRERGAQIRPVDADPHYLAEIHVLGLLDPVMEEAADGEPVDVTRRVLLEHFRTRDGFSMPRWLYGA